MADKKELDVKEPVREPKLLKGKVSFISKGVIYVAYTEKGVVYGTTVDYNDSLHSKLGVGDDIQIPV